MMRINNLSNSYPVYGNNKGPRKVSALPVNPEKDGFKISEKAAEFQFALKKVRETEDIRMDKVREIKERVETGTYKVDARAIAEKMLRDANGSKNF